MAARRARPAARAASPARRVASLPRERSAHSGDRDGLCPGAGAFRMGRGEEHPDRIPLCCERSDSLQDLCGRTGRPIAGGHSGECHTGGRGIAAADAHHTDRFRPRGRSHWAGVCSKPRSTRREHHGVQRPRGADPRKMAPIAQRGRASCQAGRRHLQPGHRTFRPIVQPRDRVRLPDPSG